jgi:hypothetical protein
MIIETLYFKKQTGQSTDIFPFSFVAINLFLLSQVTMGAIQREGRRVGDPLFDLVFIRLYSRYCKILLLLFVVLHPPLLLFRALSQTKKNRVQYVLEEKTLPKASFENWILLLFVQRTVSNS